MDNGVQGGPREIFQRGESDGGENGLELRIFFDKCFKRLSLWPFSGKPTVKTVLTSGHKVQRPRAILAALDPLEVFAHLSDDQESSPVSVAMRFQSLSCG